MSFVKADIHFPADLAAETNPNMCQAHGCPNRWTISDDKGKLCRWHRYAEPHDWPSITQQIKLGLAPERPVAKVQHQPLSEERKRLLKEARMMFAADRAMDKGWAHRLKAREEAGEVLTPAQKDLWRQALRHRDDQE